MPEIGHERIIMGIDPGTNVMGYALLSVDAGKPNLMLMGVIKLSKFEDHYLRLRRIYERVHQLVTQHLPDELAIEAPFFGKNVQSMLKLGRAQGVFRTRRCRPYWTPPTLWPSLLPISMKRVNRSCPKVQEPGLNF